MNGFYLDPKGEFYTASLSRKGGKLIVHPLGTKQFLSIREQLRLASKGINVACKSYHFSQSETIIDAYESAPSAKGNILYETTDREWLYTVVGTNIKHFLTDYSSLANLTKEYTKKSTFQLFFEDEKQLRVILFSANVITSHVTVPLSELKEVGLSPIQSRLKQFYDKESLQLPSETILIGQANQELYTGITHIFPDDEISYLKAAGATLSPLKSECIHIHQKRNLLRYIRRSVTALSVLAVIATGLLTFHYERELQSEGEKQSGFALSAPERIRVDSLKSRVSYLKGKVQREKELHQWDELLLLLGQSTQKSKVTLARFGSRSEKQGIEILLRGSAKSEKSVHQFVKLLEESNYITRVTLNQLDKRNSSYEFSLQCLTTI